MNQGVMSAKVASSIGTSMVPRWFLRLYLKVKGWQDVLMMSSDTELLDYGDLPEHPVKWLWDKIQRGHEEVHIGVVHSWDRQVGYDTGIMEHWHRWIYYRWNRESEGWEIYEVEYYDSTRVVHPPVGSPRIGTIIKKGDLRRRR